ncbi:RNA polymerase sigma factor [Nonomuraea sp. NPDC004186]
MSADTHRFEAVYRATYDQITAYAGRRCDSPQDAADVVAETFVIVWRKIDELPPGAEARLWVYGVARNVLAERRPYLAPPRADASPGRWKEPTSDSR